MKPILYWAFFLLPLLTSAQRNYTYITDRSFFDVEVLLGYDFRPYQVEIQDQMDRTMRPGEYSFGITRTHLYVEGPEIQGVYQISSISPTEYGYILNTINARDARLSGHLKVILNQWSLVEALVFRRSPDDAEIIFYLADIPDKLRKSESAYFTNWDKMVLPNPDSLWGKTIQPFFRIHQESGIQERLQMEDSTQISFIEEITIEEKTKQVASSDSTEVADSIIVVKSKEIREYFVEVRSILQYADGTKEDKTERYPIKKVVEREFKTPRINEERFEWEFSTTNGDPIFLYLNGKHAVASMKIDGKLYQVRGY